MAITTLVAQLLTISVLSLQRQTYHNRGMNRTAWNDSYDFIVIGGGTSGAIVAGRLSANPNVTVLLLEAGGPLTLTSDIMQTFYFLDYDWGYRTTPQRNAGFGLHDRRVPATRGKILGGSHTINFAAYTRGNQHDFNRWANEYGATGWNFTEVMPYFLRSENNTDPELVARYPQYHSTTGPVEISTTPHPDPILNRWLYATEQLGWPISDFSNPVDQYGSSILQTTQSATNWTRQTTAAAFIEVNIERPNLHVLVNAHVTRVLFDSAGNSVPTANGIEFFRNNRTYRVGARREVILSAGAFNSPQILMLSGIGPANHLTQHGIAPILDLPGVGENLYEHFIIPFDFVVRNASDIDLTRNLYNSLSTQNLYDFLVHATGPLTRLQLTETYIATGVNGVREWPDVALYVLINQVAPSVEALLPTFDQSNQEEWRKYLSQFLNNDRHLWFAFSLFRPLSTGTVRLASSDPFTAPLIDPNYFGNRQDLVAITRGMSIGMKILESVYMAPYVEYSRVPVPGCAFCPGKPLSECYSYLACCAQTFTLTTFHPVGSCRMGNSSSTDAVVDERLRVRGVRNLRVVDASIMPTITNSNTNAPAMMIGEMGAELIARDNGLL